MAGGFYHKGTKDTKEHKEDQVQKLFSSIVMSNIRTIDSNNLPINSSPHDQYSTCSRAALG